MLRFIRLQKNRSCNRYPSALSFSILLFLLFYLPVILLVSGIVPFYFRWFFLAGIFAITMLISLHNGHHADELGLRMVYLKQSLGANTLFILFVAVFFLIFGESGLLTTDTDPPRALFFVFYILVSSPLQEFLFRSFLFAEMNRSGITRPSVQILVSACSFAFIHIIYFDTTTILATFAAGIVLAGIYRKYPNLAGVSLAHAIAGTMAILSGIARSSS
ncbi:MAG: CPBP family intramembrane metalloprotease [Chlorobium sp.]|jgi:membrane protease YdiL (CAAX protease family)|uniref:CPBP family intramembrane glutamic endopeptidase n=1 Tax=Chlorobium sp. TaxID=1095 RepID=UPI001DBDF66D|nr:CPBP family intramembrane glutamic endopeptidase [Chlorobium sp.]MBN1279011.1 CPBP family intramembrane metalloprotease [Chlorobiaceae bacterium]MCF8215735.1 CPBP family intramembrane metalloprotease [Chlorobium sp.]MCF8270531.1 CPBP family intramembrane metalloprotease [Chlorobium sp.]MCF8286945.1 CPBP family intramembrane metalloprotease [Chlorobium sp.]MCF8290541.1 CPBP family intramembrane metalloprotease [Chlorobium sp.]